MAKDRQRAREARAEQRRREVEAAAVRRERRARRAELREKLTPAVPRRRRRFGQLSTGALLRVIAAFFVLQAVFWLYVSGLAARFAFAVLSGASLLVIVRTRKRPAR